MAKLSRWRGRRWLMELGEFSCHLHFHSRSFSFPMGYSITYSMNSMSLNEQQMIVNRFLTFEYLMRLHTRRTSTPRSSISAPLIALYGGIAGEVLWLSSYPFDVVKSKMQSDGFGVGMRYANMRDVWRQTWREEGMRGFWKGIGPTCVRALPVSAGTFIVVEMVMRAMG